MSLIILINSEPVKPAQGEAVEVEAGVYSVLIGGNSWQIYAIGNEITVGGTRFSYEVSDPRQWKRSRHAADAHGRASLTAAMPGKIVRVLVAVGDEVEAGQGIVLAGGPLVELALV